MAVDFRPPSPSDKNFILSSWTESFRRSPWSGTLPDKPFYDEMRAHLSELMLRPSTSILCCFAPGEQPPNDVLGWVCFEADKLVLHYVYVKHAFRGEGVARALLKRSGLSGGTYTHKTKSAVDYVKAHSGWKYDPRHARYDLHPAGR